MASTISNISNANPGVVTTAAPHGFATGQKFTTSGPIVGMAGPGGESIINHHFIASGAMTADTIELVDEATGAPFDTSAYSAYVSGGKLIPFGH